MIYEFFFIVFFKQIGREIRNSGSKLIEIPALKFPLMDNPKIAAFLGSSSDVLYENDIIQVLIIFIFKILKQAGLYIQATVHHHHPNEGQASIYPFLIKKHYSVRKSDDYLLVNKAKASPAKEVELFCEEYNDTFKSLRKREDHNTFFTFAMDKLITLIQDKEAESPSSRTAPSIPRLKSDLGEQLAHLKIYIISNYQKLYDELYWSLNIATLRHNKLVKLFWSYFHTNMTYF